MGKAFYKGGFEQRMTKREASLILSLRLVPSSFLCLFPLLPFRFSLAVSLHIYTPVLQSGS